MKKNIIIFIIFLSLLLFFIIKVQFNNNSKNHKENNETNEIASDIQDNKLNTNGKTMFLEKYGDVDIEASSIVVKLKESKTLKEDIDDYIEMVDYIGQHMYDNFLEQLTLNGNGGSYLIYNYCFIPFTMERNDGSKVYSEIYMSPNHINKFEIRSSGYIKPNSTYIQDDTEEAQILSEEIDKLNAENRIVKNIDGFNRIFFTSKVAGLDVGYPIPKYFLKVSDGTSFEEMIEISVGKSDKVYNDLIEVIEESNKNGVAKYFDNFENFFALIYIENETLENEVGIKVSIDQINGVKKVEFFEAKNSSNWITVGSPGFNELFQYTNSLLKDS